MEILSEYGLTATILVSCLAVIAFLLKSKHLSWNPEQNKNKSSDNVQHSDRRAIDLRNHDFFNNIAFKINVDIPIETFSADPHLNSVYRDLLTFLLTTYSKNHIWFVNMLKLDCGVEEWTTQLSTIQYDVMQEFQDVCKRNSIEESKIKLFVAWYSHYTRKIYKYINGIAKIDDLNPVVRTSIFLLVLELILATVVADMQKSIKLDEDSNEILITPPSPVGS